jgi:hypothetical protein
MTVDSCIEELADAITHLDEQERETLLMLLSPDGEELLRRKREIDEGRVSTLSETQLFDG